MPLYTRPNRSGPRFLWQLSERFLISSLCPTGIIQRFLQTAGRNGELSFRKSGKSVSKELVVARDQLSLIAESYRTIRTALLFSQAEHPPKVILLTSPCPNEGKTVTTLNLGIALAQSGKRILVIDGDLRKGRCHQLVNIKNQQGLTNVLTGQANLANAFSPQRFRVFTYCRAVFLRQIRRSFYTR